MYTHILICIFITALTVDVLGCYHKETKFSHLGKLLSLCLPFSSLSGPYKFSTHWPLGICSGEQEASFLLGACSSPWRVRALITQISISGKDYANYCEKNKVFWQRKMGVEARETVETGLSATTFKVWVGVGQTKCVCVGDSILERGSVRRKGFRQKIALCV